MKITHRIVGTLIGVACAFWVLEVIQWKIYKIRYLFWKDGKTLYNCQIKEIIEKSDDKGIGVGEYYANFSKRDK